MPGHTGLGGTRVPSRVRRGRLSPRGGCGARRQWVSRICRWWERRWACRRPARSLVGLHGRAGRAHTPGMPRGACSAGRIGRFGARSLWLRHGARSLAQRRPLQSCDRPARYMPASKIYACFTRIILAWPFNKLSGLLPCLRCSRSCGRSDVDDQRVRSRGPPSTRDGKRRAWPLLQPLLTTSSDALLSPADMIHKRALAPRDPQHQLRKSHRAVQIAPVLARIRAANGAFAAKAPCMARILASTGKICTARCDGADVGGAGAPRPFPGFRAPKHDGGSGREGLQN